MHYYFHEDIDPQTSRFELNADESHHAVKVLRQNKGDILNLLNGKGGIFEAQIIEAHPKGCLMEIIKASFNAAFEPKIHIALSFLKNRDRMEWFLEKAIEIGVSEISFFTSKHSEKKSSNEERLLKIGISALKQSGNTWLPKINAHVSFEGLLNEAMTHKYIAYCPVESSQHLTHFANHSDALVLIGPEGDFTEEEVAQAHAKGFISVSLGEQRLRAETAALVSLLTLKLKNA